MSEEQQRARAFRRHRNGRAGVIAGAITHQNFKAVRVLRVAVVVYILITVEVWFNTDFGASLLNQYGYIIKLTSQTLSNK